MQQTEKPDLRKQVGQLSEGVSLGLCVMATAYGIFLVNSFSQCREDLPGRVLAVIASPAGVRVMPAGGFFARWCGMAGGRTSSVLAGRPGFGGVPAKLRRTTPATESSSGDAVRFSGPRAVCLEVAK